MSGHSFSEECCMCGSQMDCYTDWKPHQGASGECLDCGFTYFTEESQMTLEEVNQRREEADLEPLKKLKKQTL